MVKVCLICGDSETAGLSDCTEPAFEKIKEFCNEWHQLGRLVMLREWPVQYRYIISLKLLLIFKQFCH